MFENVNKTNVFWRAPQPTALSLYIYIYTYICIYIYIYIYIHPTNTQRQRYTIAQTFNVLSPLGGSNPSPYAYEAHALPAELRRPCDFQF